MVSPNARITNIDTKIDNGMDMAMMKVLRQLPKNKRISVAVSKEAITASCKTLSIADFTKID